MPTLETISTLSSIDAPETATTSPPDGLRLRRRGAGVVGGFVDGGWWPRTLDLSVELPQLLTEISSSGYEVFRVIYNLTAWDPAPRRLNVSGHLVKLGGFRTHDPAAVSLVDTTGRKRVDLVVIPPQTDLVIAERALTLAGLDGDLHRADEILELARQ